MVAFCRFILHGLFAYFIVEALFCEIATAQEYHQNDYIAKLEIVQVIAYNKVYIKNPKVDMVWLNRTQRVINGSANILQNLSNDIMGEIQVYKFSSNEYRFFPITIRRNACETFNKNYCGVKTFFMTYSNLTPCPVAAGFYQLNNAVVDFSKFPPHMPAGRYKSVAKAYYMQELLLELHVYGSVEAVQKWKF